MRKYAAWCEPVHWLMTITLDKKFNRDELLIYMKEKGVDCRQMINPVHKAQHFINDFDDEFPVSKSISRQSLHLPSGLNIKKKDIEYISGNLREYLKRKSMI